MKASFTAIESTIIDHLKEISQTKNHLLQKDLEKADSLKKCFKGIIEALDSFDDIEERLKEKGLLDNEFVSKTMKRFETVKIRLMRTLGEFGVSKLEFPENKLIIGFCEVLETEPDPTRKNDEIIAVVRNGYIRGKQSIRDAQVIIVKN